MKAKAGNGVCLIQSRTGKMSKVNIAKNANKELYCMYKGKRYILDKKKIPTKSYITVVLTRGRKRNSYNKKRTNSRRKR